MRQAIAFFTCILFLLIAVCAANARDSLPSQQYGSGHFEGHALNTTVNQPGKVVLDLYDFSSASGSVRAYLGYSEGLSGEAWLSGTIDSHGELHLTGRLLDFTVEVNGRLTSTGTINATYRLKGNQPQEGNFEVRFQHPLPSMQGSKSDRQHATPGIADLIGAWEVGGGMPAQRSPITGEATGVSFTEARRLEVFPDGTFKHLQTHRHCSGTGVSRCCQEQAVLEQGTLSVDGSRLNFDIEGGGTIVKDGCNPTLSKQAPVKPRKASFAWSIRPGSGGGSGSALCLQIDSNDVVCYLRQS
ncbi:MAG TPA: hypothetical protein VKA60_03450 [Blastocatellia bacterium]|nr:hypothetical protein [Blastocatellia bacterium]